MSLTTHRTQNLFDIEDESGNSIVAAKRDGSIVLHDSIEPDQGAIQFWQSVSDYLPLDKQEIIDNKTLLIKTFATLREIKSNVKFNSSVEADKFYKLEKELNEFFTLAQ